MIVILAFSMWGKRLTLAWDVWNPVAERKRKKPTKDNNWGINIKGLNDNMDGLPVGNMIIITCFFLSLNPLFNQDFLSVL